MYRQPVYFKADPELAIQMADFDLNDFSIAGLVFMIASSGPAPSKLVPASLPGTTSYATVSHDGVRVLRMKVD